MLMMKKKIRFYLVLIGLFLPGVIVSNAQVLVESIAAIVGNEVIYLSDLENTIADMRRSGDKTPYDQLRCNVFQDMLISKLFLDKARIDSITVADDAVDADLNMRMNDAIRRAGSEEALVEYFKKGIVEIKHDIRKSLLEQETVREVQSKISENISITPGDVKRYFATIPKDSLPIIPAAYQLGVIQIDPPSNEENKADARQKLLDIRSQILAGKSFNVLAIMYSEDVESAKKGGEIGFLTRGELEKPYADAAFSLTMGTVSKIVETKFGFHIIQLIDRKGDMVNTRHILIRPQVKPEQSEIALAKLDSIANQIRKDSLKFETAALMFSTHKDSRINGGLLVSPSPSERVSWLSLEELNKEMYVKVRDLKVGEISDAFKTVDENNNPVFRIVKLINEIPAHTANLKDDYQIIYNATLTNARSKIYDKWIKEKIKSTYIKISDECKSCDFLKNRVAEIRNFPKFFIGLRFRFSQFLVLILISIDLNAQVTPVERPGRKAIDLKNADIDYIERDKQTGKDWHRLLGNVSFLHNNVTLLCDSAHYLPDKNQVTAYSRVHIRQGDTLNLFSDYLFYDGRTEMALAKGNVELIDRETHLYTDTINYDVRNKIASYDDRGRMTNAQNTLTSIVGIYDVTHSLFHFKDSVKIVNPQYVMTADTMDYNTKTEISYFTGPSQLKGDSLYLYSEKGWYDTKNDVTTLWKHAMIDNKKQIIHGDSLYFDNISGFGQSFRNVIIQDTANDLAVLGEYAWYFKEPEKFLVTDSAVFIQVSKTDSLFLHADTISSVTVTDTTSLPYRLMKAYHGCRIFSKGLQAKCDSLIYSFQDSVIRLYNAPVIWSEENQLTADSMAVFTKNRQTDRLELFTSAFITSQIDSLRFNQIKGRSLTGYFKNNELFKIDIKGNGESIYYLLDGEEIAGVNQSKCANIEAFIDHGKVTEIYEYQEPEGNIEPPDPKKPKKLRLEGFSWLSALRPKDKYDIFRE